jgi:hypothetical protein
MNLNNDIPPSISPVQTFHRDSGRRSLPPFSTTDPRHALPTYPSSTLQYYYPSSRYIANYAHTPNFFQPISSHPHGGASGLLPSVSQSHVPSLRRTPSVHESETVPAPVFLTSPLLDQCFNNNSHFSVSARSAPISPTSPLLDQRFNNDLHPAHRYQPTSPATFAQQPPAPVFAAPQPVHASHVPFLLPYVPPQPVQPHSVIALPTNPTIHTTFNSSLPSTKDVPILSGKHDWGPWHGAIRTLILNANLLGHIADEPYPGAVYDPTL